MVSVRNESGGESMGGVRAYRAWTMRILRSLPSNFSVGVASPLTVGSLISSLRTWDGLESKASAGVVLGADDGKAPELVKVEPRTDHNCGGCG